MKRFSTIAMMFGTIFVLLSCEPKVEHDAHTLAKLFCRQSKLVESSPNLNTPQVQKELADIEAETAKINDEILKKYSKDQDAMNRFAQTYGNDIKNCK